MYARSQPGLPVQFADKEKYFSPLETKDRLGRFPQKYVPNGLIPLIFLFSQAFASKVSKRARIKPISLPFSGISFSSSAGQSAAKSSER